MTLGSHQKSIGTSQVHITPREILDPLGVFDLDPCAADPRPWDCAEVNLTESNDGLARHWPPSWRVWLNPPFHRYRVGKWIEKLAEHGNGIALLHARTETEWFRAVWERADAILFLADRIVFRKPDGSPQTISNPKSKHYGKAANSGAPVVLVAFGELNVSCLRQCGLPGYLVTGWRSIKEAA